MTAARQRGLRLSAVVLLPLVLTGCFRDSRFKPTFRVTGRVLFEGEPATGATVVLVPENPHEPLDPWVRPRGLVDGDGGFTITTYFPGDGVPAGDYVVLAYWLPPGGPSSGAANRLPDRYTTREGSPARVSVTTESVDLGTITLRR